MIMDTAIVRSLTPFLGLLAFMGASTSQASAVEQPVRQSTNTNALWKYRQGDVIGAEANTYNDAAWQPIGLPHSFSIPYFLSTDFYVGYGWYRHHLQVPSAAKGKRLTLEFDGVFQETEVFVNGKRVGDHKGGYTGFSVDFTSCAKVGDNLVAVRVNNIWNPRLAPRAGEHVFSGGIYRNVRFVITEPVHVPWCGTSITTPEVSNKRATVRVSTQVVNHLSVPKTVRVRHQVLDPSGKEVAAFGATQTILASGTATFDQLSPSLGNPRLWHPDHPFLYSLKTTVFEGKRVVDQVSAPFGIRSIKWTADQGFFLNGEHLYLRGANVHQDQAGWGDAVTDAAIERDLKMMKEAGFNFIRGSHYPHAPAFAAACDRLGLVFWCENDFWSTYTGGREEGYWNASGYPTKPEDQAEFEANAKRQLSEMIQIYRNHPSITVWSMCNEPFFCAGQVMPKVRGFLRDLVDLTHQLDPTRPAALGGVQRPTDAGRIDKIGDIAGYNGDGAGIAEFQNSGIPNMVSEYGSTSADRPGKYEPGWGDLTPDQGEALKPWRAGQAIWAGFDHGTIAGDAFGKMGIVDYFRIPKRSWYWYRNAYSKIPPPEWPAPGVAHALTLTAHRQDGIRIDGTDDVQLTVTVKDAQGKAISNSPAVELSIVSGPGEFPTGRSIRFEQGSDIRILDGKAAIAIRAYQAGKTVIRATSTGLEPGEATLHFVGSTPYIEGKTPLVQPRPYVRFHRDKEAVAVQRFGHNNPTFVSSALLGHPGALVTDGDPKTYWQPESGDQHPSVTVDLERFVQIHRVRLALGSAFGHRAWIEASDDQSQWRVVSELAALPGQLNLVAPAGTSGRFLRVRFSSGGEGLRVTELEVFGTLRTQ